MADKIVAIGLLTQHDLDVLGTSFKRLFPVRHDGSFADLIRQLDDIEASPAPHEAAGGGSPAMEPSGR